MATATLMTESIYLRLVFSFRGFVHYHYGRKHGIMQADMVLERYLRFLHLDLQAVGRESEPLGLA